MPSRSYRNLTWVGLTISALGCSGASSNTRRPDATEDASVGGGEPTDSSTLPPPSGSDGNGFIVPPGSIASADSGAPSDDDPTNPGITHPKCGSGLCTDFPEKPILGEGVPDNAPTLFGDPGNFTVGALCVQEPQLSTDKSPGTMIPANWLRPRFKFTGTGLDLFEIRIHSPAQKNELVAYTKKSPWYLPKELWAGTSTGTAGIPAGSGAANNGAGTPFTVTIRGINSASPGMPVGVKGDFEVAPVVATGSMVFWTVNSAQVTPDSSKLLGFTVGDEGVAETLNLSGLQWAGQIGENGSVLRGYYDAPKVPNFTDGQVRCIGCHASTPDGTAVIFTDDWPWSKAVASVTAGSIGTIPTWLTPGGRALLKMPWLGTQTMSKAHWQTGDRVVITSYGVSTKSGALRSGAWFGLPAPTDKIKVHQLAWIDLETTAVISDAVTDVPDYGQPLNDRQAAVTAAKGTGWGIIATGDTASAVSPSMNHAGDTIAYTLTDYSPDGHADYTATIASVRTVPYNLRAGGASAPLGGASDPNFLSYYPSYSADDKWIAFTRAPQPSATSPDGPYYNRFGDVMIVPSAGGTAIRLTSNDPNQCVGDTVSRGIINSWPKWAPNAFTAHGKTYYFLIFSSARKYGDEFSQQFQLPSSTASSYKGLNDSSQLWLTTVVVDDTTNQVTSYPALYIWNQNRLANGGTGKSIQFSNLTPAWDPFQLPAIVIPVIPPDDPAR